MATYTLANLEKFGLRELDAVIALLKKYAHAKEDNALPCGFDETGVTIMFNHKMGTLFLTNDEHQVLTYGRRSNLEMVYVLGYWGHEGRIGDLWDAFLAGDIRPEDWEELAYYLEQEDMTEEAQQVRAAIKDEEASA